MSKKQLIGLVAATIVLCTACAARNSVGALLSPSPVTTSPAATASASPLQATTPLASGTVTAAPSATAAGVVYENKKYGFRFALPDSWKGYTIVDETWKGTKAGGSGETTVATGPELLIRHPKWTTGNPRQDIPILVFTTDQWNKLNHDEFHIGAAPINPSELGHNGSYVFALPARYNYAFPTGWEEVQQILDGKPLHAFAVLLPGGFSYYLLREAGRLPTACAYSSIHSGTY